MRIGFNLRQYTCRQQLAAKLPRTRPQIEQIVGGAQHVGIVLHHHDGVAQVAQLFQNVDQPCRIRVCKPMEGSSNT